METTYYNDIYNVYRKDSLVKRLKQFKKYIIVDAGQLVIGLIGLSFLVL